MATWRTGQASNSFTNMENPVENNPSVCLSYPTAESSPAGQAQRSYVSGERNCTQSIFLCSPEHTHTQNRSPRESLSRRTQPKPAHARVP